MSTTPRAARGKARKSKNGGSNWTGFADAGQHQFPPPQSLKQRIRALDTVTQKQWLDTMNAERTAAGRGRKDAAGGANRGTSFSVPARL